MQYCVEHPEEVSKLVKVKAQVSQVQDVMMQNIDQVYIWTIVNLSIKKDTLQPNETSFLKDKGVKVLSLTQNK